MSFIKFANSKIKKIDFFDFQLVKISSFFFALTLAILFPIIISLDWYIYAVIFILAAIRPFYKVFFK